LPRAVAGAGGVPSLVAAIAASAVRPVVLVDGGSGSGKTTLATALAAAWASPVTLIRLDDIYPGWDGLDAASAHLHDDVLLPFASGAQARWRGWDWTADAPADWHGVDPAVPLLVEGSGALSRANRALASFAVWIELDAVTRKQRALDRDGDAYRPHWDRWAAQESAFREREHPVELADVVVDGRLIAGP
jgi:energy-coupling factor transporter ATP-binding protein EcfA2